MRNKRKRDEIMKMAIEFKEDDQQLTFILHTLNIRNFKIGETSHKYTFWIYNLKNIQFFGNYIQIEKENDFNITKIYLDNIEYFEIHKES